MCCDARKSKGATNQQAQSNSGQVPSRPPTPESEEREIVSRWVSEHRLRSEESGAPSRGYWALPIDGNARLGGAWFADGVITSAL